VVFRELEGDKEQYCLLPPLEVLLHHPHPLEVVEVEEGVEEEVGVEEVVVVVALVLILLEAHLNPRHLNH